MKPLGKLLSERRLRPARLSAFLTLLAASPACAGSDTWLVNPGSGDWNTAANWAGGTVPNSAVDVATFDSSSITGLSISTNTQVNSIVFNAGASGYTITANAPLALTLSGAGIINNSGVTQSFVAPVNGTGGVGLITFTNSATAGSNTAFTAYGGTAADSSGGDIEFRDSSNAGSASFTLHGSNGGSGGGIVGFSDTASAADGNFTIYGNILGGGYGTGYLQFHGSATAGNGTFRNTTYGSSNISGGVTYFYNSSTAGSSTFINDSGAASGSSGGRTIFTDTSSAGNATITNHGGTASNIYNAETRFDGGSTVGNATIINNAGTGSGAFGGATILYTSSTTGNGTFINNGGAVSGSRGGMTQFYAASGAGNGTFINNAGTAGNTFGGWTEFYDTSTAGNSTFTNHGGTVDTAGGGVVKFYYSASAGNATFTNYAGTVGGSGGGANGGAVVFDYGDASASNGTFINHGAAVSGAKGGSTQFFNISGAGNATITNHGGTGDGANGGDTPFYGSSSAVNSSITNNGGTVSGAFGGITKFMGTATAANATVTANGGTVSGALGGTTQFLETATAGNATLIANGGTGAGGSIQFLSTSTGGTARVKVFGNGNLDISQHNTGVTIGSIEGTGNVFLGARTLTLSNNLSTTLSGVIQDGGVGVGTAGKLTKTGTGTLTLTGANTYTGATTVNGGTLVLDTVTNATVLSSSSSLSLGGSTFQLKGNSGTQAQTVNGLTLTTGGSVVQVNNLGTSTTLTLGNITRSAGGGTVDFNANNGTFGTNAVIKTTKVNVNGIFGAWATVNGGTALATKNASNEIVAYTAYTALDAQGGGTNPIINDGTALNYRINAAGSTGTVALAAIAGGTTNINTLTQNFSTAATIDTASKTLRVGIAGGILLTPTKAALTIGTAMDSGVLTAGGSAINVAGDLILSNFSDSTLTINSTITNNGTGAVRMIKTGGGLVLLNGSNSYTGGATVNAGTLRVGNTSALGTVSSPLRLNGGTLDLATDTSVNAWNTTIASSVTLLSNKATESSAGITHTLGTLAIGAQTLNTGAGNNVANHSAYGVTFGATTLSGNPTFDVTNNGDGLGTLTLGRLTTGSARTITKTGTGTLILVTPSNPSVTAGSSLVVNNGIVQLNNNNALGSSASTSVTVNATTPGSTVAFNLNNVTQPIASLTFGGIGGTSTSTNNVATGTGTLTLGGNVTYDATGNPLGSTLSGILALGANRTFTVGDSSNANADLTISATITGSTTSGIPSVTKVGAGTLVLTGTNTFNRGLSINEGVVSVDSLPTANAASTIGVGTLQLAGGTLRYTGGAISTTRVFTMATRGGEIELTQSGTVLTINSAFNGAGANLLSDALVKSGPGTLVLGGTTTNNDGLDVIVDEGLLQLAKSSTATRHAIGHHLVVNSGGTAQLAGSGNDQIQDDALVAINTGGTLDFNGRNETFDGLSGGGSITNTSTTTNSTMTVGARNHLAGKTTFSGVISNGATRTMSLTKIGLSTQTLSGTNTYTGATIVNAGKLLINGNNSAATGAVTVNTGGTLGGSGTIGGATVIANGGILSPGNSPGVLTFDSNLTLSNGSRVIIEGGDLILVDGTLDLDDWTLSLAGNLQDGGSITLFTFGSLASAPDLFPTFDLASLGFTPTSPLSLSTSGSSIVLNGVSAIPEPSACALLGLSFGVLLIRRRRSAL